MASFCTPRTYSPNPPSRWIGLLLPVDLFLDLVLFRLFLFLDLDLDLGAVLVLNPMEVFPLLEVGKSEL